MNDSYQPTEPPTEKKRPGRPRKSAEDKAKVKSKRIVRPTSTARATSTAPVDGTLLDDTFAHYIEITQILDQLSAHSCAAIVKALSKRYG